jgi:hypothetical protein
MSDSQIWGAACLKPQHSRKGLKPLKFFQNFLHPEFRNWDGREEAQRAQNTGRESRFVGKETLHLSGESKLRR